MKILVVGREGQVARSLIDAEKPSGLTVTSLGRPDLDITEVDSIRRAVDNTQPDIVVNAAAHTAVDKAESELEVAMLVNAEGPRNLAEICAKRSVPLIHISTDYVYDGRKSTYYVEDDPVQPLGVYGRSKLEGERFVASMCPQHVILRTAWVYSPYGNNFVKTMLRLADSRRELGIVSDQRGSPTYAPHLANAILAIAAHLESAAREPGLWGVFHAAGSGEATWFEFAEEIFRRSAELGGPRTKANAITTADYPTPAERPANSRLDCSKLAETYGVHMPDWHDGVADCVRQLVVKT